MIRRSLGSIVVSRTHLFFLSSPWGDRSGDDQCLPMDFETQDYGCISLPGVMMWYSGRSSVHMSCFFPRGRFVTTLMIPRILGSWHCIVSGDGLLDVYNQAVLARLGYCALFGFDTWESPQDEILYAHLHCARGSGYQCAL